MGNYWGSSKELQKNTFPKNKIISQEEYEDLLKSYPHILTKILKNDKKLITSTFLKQYI